MSAREFPDDVYEESCSRLPVPNREDLPDEAKKMFDYFHDPDGGTYAGIRGPGCIRLHSPQLLTLGVPVSRYVRYESGIPEDVRELAILVTGRAFDSQFEWTAHEPAALKAGVPKSTVDIVRDRKPTNGLPEAHDVIITLGRRLWEERKTVPKDLYKRAIDLWGPRMLVDILWLMGNYAWTAALIATFDVQVHPEKEPLLPLP
ncbi:MAG: carboxymuconolactone decarboxylase family protein [Alphaproteobacteria bacterium]|nr:carboxymuconolactone decarboxylase family protein [Alphaproteobacteria bacterium]